MKLQVALDLVDLYKSIELTRQLCRAGLEIVEVGTPLIKSWGLPAISAVKVACPTAEVVADLKTADVGRLEARLAKDFGADWGTVLAATNIETIVEFVESGREMGLKTAVDLIGVSNLVERVREIAKLTKPDMFIIHIGIDVQKKTGLNLTQLLHIARVVREENHRVAVAGGITEREVEILARDKVVDVVIVGRAVVSDPSPVAKFTTLNKILKS